MLTIADHILLGIASDQNKARKGESPAIPPLYFILSGDSLHTALSEVAYTSTRRDQFRSCSNKSSFKKIKETLI